MTVAAIAPAPAPSALVPVEKPRSPKSAYMFFCEAARLSPIMACGLWAQLGKEGRAKYEELAKRDKEEYKAEWGFYMKQVDPAGALMAKVADLIPKRRTSAFFLFTQDGDKRREAETSLKESGQEVTMARVTKKLGEMWRRAPQMVRSVYEERAEQSCPGHKTQMAQWRKTPEFAQVSQLRREARQRAAEKKRRDEEGVVVGELLKWPRKEDALRRALEDTPTMLRNVASPCRNRVRRGNRGGFSVESSAMPLSNGADAGVLASGSLLDGIDFRPAATPSPRQTGGPRLRLRAAAAAPGLRGLQAGKAKEPTPRRRLIFRKGSPQPADAMDDAGANTPDGPVQPKRLVFQRGNGLEDMAKVKLTRRITSKKSLAAALADAARRRNAVLKRAKKLSASAKTRSKDCRKDSECLAAAAVAKPAAGKRKVKAKAAVTKRIKAQPAMKVVGKTQLAMKSKRKAVVKLKRAVPSKAPMRKKKPSFRPMRKKPVLTPKASRVPAPPPVAWFCAEFGSKGESPGRMGWVGSEWGCKQSPTPAKPKKQKKMRWLDYEFGGCGATFDARSPGIETPAPKARKKPAMPVKKAVGKVAMKSVAKTRKAVKKPRMKVKKAIGKVGKKMMLAMKKLAMKKAVSRKTKH